MKHVEKEGFLRNVHTVVEIAHKQDIQASIELTAAFLQVAHEGDYTL